ncbi:sensor histidine kinase [Flavobacteriaceae bacterium AU392]|nr:sensor histidine kinase [Flavobacteriaceae bacterium]RKM85402.1 sensor histidine kinase [Flavobacteriaceae bacterium AU392]
MVHLWILLCITQTEAVSKEQVVLIAYFIIAILLFTVLFIVFFITFQKRKNKLLLDKIKQQQIFEEEISKTQLEVQEQTLKNIGWELHDNVGQLLSFTGMQMNLLASQVKDELKDKVDNANNLLKESIQEVRALSKTLNSDALLNQGLHQSIQNEIDRLNKLKSIAASFIVEGGEKPFSNPKDEIVIFRILQEFLSNSVKYSEAQNLTITLNYTQETLLITAKDDGKGFDMNTVKKNSGLINMNNRAALINATCDIVSQPDNGVLLELNYPLS